MINNKSKKFRIINIMAIRIFEKYFSRVNSMLEIFFPSSLFFKNKNSRTATELESIMVLF